jgi:hypothetical protein
MQNSPTLFIILVLFTLAVLIVGIIIMGMGGKVNKKYSNKLMIARVATQAITIIALIVFFILMKKSS